MYKLELYFKPSVHYAVSLEAIRQQMRDIADKWKVALEEFSVDMLSEEQVRHLIDELRSIPPQVRGRIVSSRGRILPLSGSKLLNITNTPIILVRENDVAICVFPHLLGTTYFDLESSLDRILSHGPRGYFQDRGLLENPIVKILADNPTLIEEGMKFVGSSVESSAGSIDIILRDREGNDVVVEVETKARDNAVGQVLRLARGYAEQTGKKSIRKAIVCSSFDAGLPLACKEAEIGLFLLNFLKVDDARRSYDGVQTRLAPNPD